MFTQNIYIKRHKVLSSKISSGITLIIKNNESVINYIDNTY